MTEFPACSLTLLNFGNNKIAFIRCVREYLGIGLAEAQAICNSKFPYQLPDLLEHNRGRQFAEALRKLGVDMKLSERIGESAPTSVHYTTSIGNGSSYEMRLQHDELKAFKLIKGSSIHDLELRARMQLHVWEEKWQRQRNLAEKLSRAWSEQARKSLAAERTKEAEVQVRALETMLVDCWNRPSLLSWDDLKDTRVFALPAPQKATHLANPPGPEITSFQPTLSFMDKLVSSRGSEKRRRSADAYNAAKLVWESTCRENESVNSANEEQYKAKLSEWKSAKLLHERAINEKNRRVDELKELYFFSDSSAIELFCSELLSRSNYPGSFPSEFNLQLNRESGALIVDYELPNEAALPKTKEVKYIARKQEFQDVLFSETWVKRTYEDVLYKICLRSIYELLSGDVANALTSVVFNGWVRSTNRATGAETHGCIISLHVSKDEFLDINLSSVDPKACFRRLKGVSGSKLSELTPIRPIVNMNMTDERFVDPYTVINDVDERTNLAAMDWLDFENLIREIFEKEFSQNGGQVKITQASRDGGVDAIAFDPDPIRGGKIVIQAKRYTNTVGVSAVRDLYGTVHNEGATKGILVTTSDFGPDAHEFAKGKPLTLLCGSELLYLLGRHGHIAKIDLQQAKLLASNQK